jgi:hypothetical protein
MPDLVIVFLFFSMLLFPCFVAVRSARKDGEEKNDLFGSGSGKPALPVRR